MSAGSDLASVANSHPAETTFCLGPGRFNITTPVTAQAGDVFRGAGRGVTFLDGGDVAPHLIVGASGSTYTVRSLDALGAQGNPGCHPNCGRAFRSTAGITVEDIACYDNSNMCIGPGGDVVMRNSECYENSEPYSWADKESGACIKVVRGASLLVEGSYVHHQNWNGLWCDFCDGGSFIIRDSRIVQNGMKGISYEVSGANDAHALIENNVIQGNGWRYAFGETPRNRPAGITCNDCRDMIVRSNIFGDQALDGLGQRRAIQLLDTDRAEVAYGYDGLPGVVIEGNALNGDVIIGCSLPGVTCSQVTSTLYERQTPRLRF